MREKSGVVEKAPEPTVVAALGHSLKTTPVDEPKYVVAALGESTLERTIESIIPTVKSVVTPP